MKEKYIELMEKALSAYTDEHIQRYFNDVKTNGLTEPRFPEAYRKYRYPHGSRQTKRPYADLHGDNGGLLRYVSSSTHAQRNRKRIFCA